MTININELRRFAQAATPGPWIAKNVSGAGLEIHMAHPLYPDKEWPAFGTDSAFCKKGLVSYETWTQFPHEVRDVQQSKNAEYIAAANPTVINELLDRLEAAEAERDELRTEIADRTINVDYLYKLKKSYEKLMGNFQEERDELRVRIEAMEKQEPVAWCSTDETGTVIEAPGMNQSRRFDTPLYLVPGAQPTPSFADAYQGAMEDVAIWKKRALEAEDLNRKFVAEINGPAYMGEPAQPAPSIPEGVKKVTRGFHWNGAAQHHTPTIEVEFEPVPAGSPNNAKGWQDRDRLAAMLAATPEAKP